MNALTLPKDLLDTIETGMNAHGVQLYRCDIEDIARDLKRAGMGDDEIVSLLATSPAISDTPEPEKALRAVLTPQVSDEPSLDLELIETAPVDPLGIPKRPWIVKDVLMQGEVSMLVGMGGTAKSTKVNAFAIMLATGKDWAGYRPEKRCRTLIINAEDSVLEMQRRQYAQTTAMELSDSELELLRGMILTHKRSSYSLVTRNAEGHITGTGFFADLKKSIKQNKIDVLVCDPQVEMSSGMDENSAEMQELHNKFHELAADCNIAVWCVHHTRKSGVGGDQNSARGSSIFAAGARNVITLESMSKETAAKTLPAAEQSDHWKYICAENAKNNHGPRGAARWFETFGVEMPGTGDFTVAIRPAPFDGKTGAVASALDADWLDQFLDRLDDGRDNGDRFTVSGKDACRADFLLTSEHELPKFQARAAVAELLKAGVLAIEEYTTNQRKKRTGIVVKFRPEKGGTYDLPF
jgi:AAA domain